jgi:hypothetical protein
MTDNRTLDQVLYARGGDLPKGWRWGAQFSIRGGAIAGHYAIRNSDGCCVMVAESGESDAPTPAAAIRAAIADGLIPRAKRRPSRRRARVAHYEFVDLGCTFPEYFTGLALARTRFAKYAVGIGNSCAEALSDCLRIVADLGFDADDLSRRIRIEYGEMPEKPIEPGSFHYVGLRWN